PASQDLISFNLDCNPAIGGASFRLNVPRVCYAAITIYDPQGRRIRTLLREILSRGEHLARWDGTTDQGEPAAAGVYFVVVQVNDSRETHVIVLIR
ncbi:MAG: FlgD immunoglobulin-like domain containing protein, partial [Candidatus Thorarchaeota archaeon]